jgi:hypothetical protein
MTVTLLVTARKPELVAENAEDCGMQAVAAVPDPVNSGS